jgi:hypothetical protein
VNSATRYAPYTSEIRSARFIAAYVGRRRPRFLRTKASITGFEGSNVATSLVANDVSFPLWEPLEGLDASKAEVDAPGEQPLAVSPPVGSKTNGKVGRKIRGGPPDYDLLPTARFSRNRALTQSSAAPA